MSLETDLASPPPRSPEAVARIVGEGARFMVRIAAIVTASVVGVAVFVGVTTEKDAMGVFIEGLTFGFVVFALPVVVWAWAARRSLRRLAAHGVVHPGRVASVERLGQPGQQITRVVVTWGDQSLVAEGLPATVVEGQETTVLAGPGMVGLVVPGLGVVPGRRR